MSNNKRPATAASITPISAIKKAKNLDGAPLPLVLPITQWRVVLTGDFVVKPRPVLEQELKRKGVAVTGAISGKTTHLILGESGKNEWGKATGIGSSKYRQALEKKLTIIPEKEIWTILSRASTTSTPILGGLVPEQQQKTANAPAVVHQQTTPTVKPSSSMQNKILYAIQESGEEKLSLHNLKKELTKHYGLTFDLPRSKWIFKRAVAALVEEGKLEKSRALLPVPSVIIEQDDCTAAAVDLELLTQEEDQKVQQQKQKQKQQHQYQQQTQKQKHKHKQSQVRESNIAKLCPVAGRWRGLHVLSRHTSKSGRVRCKCCKDLIAKGERHVQVSDDSLFKMVIFPGDHHDGVSRGYTEADYGQDYTIARKRFSIHEECEDEANEKYRAIFNREWAKIRPEVIAQRSDDFDVEY